MAVDLEAIAKKGFDIRQEKSTGANSRVLIAEHPEYGLCVVKYAHPEDIDFYLDTEFCFPLSVAEKVQSGKINKDVYKATHDLPHIPNLYDRFEVPEFWDTVVEKLELDPDAIRVPTKEEVEIHGKQDLGTYYLGPLWVVNDEIVPGNMYTLDQIKELCPISAVVTQYIDGQDIRQRNRYQVRQSKLDALVETVKEMQKRGYTGMFPPGEATRGNIIMDSARKLWIHDFGTALKRENIEDNFDKYGRRDVEELQRLLQRY